MEWIIGIIVVIFIIRKININGRNKWISTIQQVIESTPSQTIANGIFRLLEINRMSSFNGADVAKIYIRYMANYIVVCAKGEQSMNSMSRDATNVITLMKEIYDLRIKLLSKYWDVERCFPANMMIDRVDSETFHAILYQM